IHWNERIARSVGLPNVIAHGMFTMAQAGRYVTDWAGDARALVGVGGRFSAMVGVPRDHHRAANEGSGTVEGKLRGKLRAPALAATGRSGDDKVLSGAGAVVRLPCPRGRRGPADPGAAPPAAQVPLAGHTTLRLGGPARRFAEAPDDAELIAQVRAADERGEP